MKHDDISDEEINAWARWLLARAPRLALNAFIYIVALLALGISAFKVLVIVALIVLLLLAHYGERWIERIGFALVVLVMLVWIGAIPPTQDWGRAASDIAHQVKQAVD